MPGFSRFDKYYYSHPSARLGGWLAFILDITKSDSIILEARASGFFSGGPLINYKSFEDCQCTLNGNHNNNIYYRGQNRRYTCESCDVVSSLNAVVPH